MNIKRIFPALLAMVSAVAFSACGDSNGSPSGVPTPPVTIGGQGPGSSGAQAQNSNVNNGTGSSAQRPTEVFPDNGVQSTTRNFYFVFDGSGSMSGALNEAKSAVRAFMQHVPDGVNLGLYVFDGRGSSERVKLAGGNRSQFMSAVDAVNVSGGTPLGAAIFAGCNALLTQYKQQLGYGEYRLVVVTDGEASDANEFERSVAYAEKAQIPIYTIGYRIGGSHSLRQHSVSYRAADNAQDLQRGLEDVLAETETFDAASFEQLYKLSGGK